MASGRCTVCGAVYTNGERFCSLDAGAVVDDDTHDPLIGRTIDDRYLVRKFIGRGGMGSVYEADHIGLDKRIALKLLAGGAIDRDALARFRREARTASKITHEHVVQIFDVGATPDHLDFIAMEFVDGRDLGQILRADGPLELPRMLAIAAQMLRGLHAIHRAGILHRDIKPANVMVVARDGVEHVKIMDFGISKSHDAETLTGDGKMIGTPQYMAPEQLTAGTLDERTDIYAAALTLFALLAGEPPFSGTTAELAAHHLDQRPPSITSIRPDVPEPVADAIARALRKDPADRFPDALAFAAALDGTAPIQRDNAATVVSRKQAATPRHRRWPWLAGGAVVAVGATIALVVANQHPTLPPPPPADARPPPSKREAAIAAEHAGNFEAAIAAYQEVSAGHPDPDIDFHIAELYERLGKRDSAVMFFERYLHDAPAAADRDAVTARIARLQQPPAPVDASVVATIDAGERRHLGAAQPAPKHCYCMPLLGTVQDTAVPLCHDRRASRCRCDVPNGSSLCPAQPIACTPCPVNGRTSSCDEHCSTRGAKCAVPNFTSLTLPGHDGEPCKGYESDRLPPSLMDGVFLCSYCAGARGGGVYLGHENDSCVGYHERTGEPLRGLLSCDR